MDMGGLFLSGDGSNLAEALSAMSEDPGIHALALCVPPYLAFRDKVANGAIVRATESLAKPAIVISYAVPGAESVLKTAGRFILEPPEPGVAALRSWLNYDPAVIVENDVVTRDGSHVQQVLGQALDRAINDGCGVILEDVGKALLRQYGVGCPDERIVADVAEAVAAAEALGYPVALKILASDMPHRGVGRGVLLGLNEATAVRTAFQRLSEHAAGHVDARLLVQAMAKPGLELLVGAFRDPEMGLALAIGMGGRNAEAAKEVRFCIPPISSAAIERLLDRWPALAEAERRRGAIDRPALVTAVAAIGRMLADGGDRISELDVNPLIVGAPGEGAIAVDALFIVRSKETAVDSRSNSGR
jgi:acyl-CoA synthetase (NDP forming)